MSPHRYFAAHLNSNSMVVELEGCPGVCYHIRACCSLVGSCTYDCSAVDGRYNCSSCGSVGHNRMDEVDGLDASASLVGGYFDELGASFLCCDLVVEASLVVRSAQGVVVVVGLFCLVEVKSDVV